MFICKVNSVRYNKFLKCTAYIKIIVRRKSVFSNDTLDNDSILRKKEKRKNEFDERRYFILGQETSFFRSTKFFFYIVCTLDKSIAEKNRVR